MFFSSVLQTDKPAGALAPGLVNKSLAQPGLSPQKDSVTLKSVKPPSFTQDDLDTAKEAFLSAEGVLSLARLKAAYGLWGAQRKKQKALKQTDKLLPKLVKQRLFRYHTSPGYVWDLLVRNRTEPGYTQRKETCLKGPIAIKEAQAQVERAKKNLQQTELLQSFFKKDKALAGLLDFLLLKPNRNTVKTYSALLDKVPEQPLKTFKKELNALTTAYETQYGEPLHLQRCLGVGSIAQVYLAESKTHGQVVLKVLRPDAKAALFDSMKPYLYARSCVEEGASQQGYAKQITEETVGVLKEEIKLENEAQKANAISTFLTKRSSALATPQFYVSLPQGFIQQYMGASTLNELQQSQGFEAAGSYLNPVVPDLLHLMAFSPEKYLDFHAGNLVATSTKGEETPEKRLGLIDFGRVNALKAEALKSLLFLYATQASQAPVSDELAPPPEAVVKAWEPLAGKQAAQAAQETPFSLLLGWAEYSQLQQRGRGKESKEPLALKPLTTAPIALGDLKQIETKLTGLLGNYFYENPTESQLEALKPVLQNPATFCSLFKELVEEKQQWRQADSIDNEKAVKQLSKVNRSIDGFDALLSLAMDNKNAAFQQALTPLLTDDKQALLRFSFAQQRLRSTAEGLTKELLQQFTPGQQATLNPEAITHTLMQELKTLFAVSPYRLLQAQGKTETKKSKEEN